MALSNEMLLAEYKAIFDELFLLNDCLADFAEGQRAERLKAAQQRAELLTQKLSEDYDWENASLTAYFIDEKIFNEALSPLEKAKACYKLCGYTEKIIRKAGKEADFYLKLGIVHAKEDATQEGGELLDKFYNLQAFNLLKNGYFAEAVEVLTTALRECPPSSSSYATRAALYREMAARQAKAAHELMEMAASDYNQAIVLTNDNSELYAARFHILVSLKKYAQAFNDYNKVLQLQGGLSGLSQDSIFKETQLFQSRFDVYLKAYAEAKKKGRLAEELPKLVEILAGGASDVK